MEVYETVHKIMKISTTSNAIDMKPGRQGLHAKLFYIVQNGSTTMGQDISINVAVYILPNILATFTYRRKILVSLKSGEDAENIDVGYAHLGRKNFD